MKLQKVNGTFICFDDAATIESARVADRQVIDVEIVNDDTGSVNMLRTWRGWMNETATAMNHWGCTMPLYVDSDGLPHGKRPYTGNDAHEQFTSVYLGVDENGARKSWTLSRKPDGTVLASIGDRLWAMDTHLAWCAEKGVKLTIPRKSEYRKLKIEQGEAK